MRAHQKSRCPDADAVASKTERQAGPSDAREGLGMPEVAGQVLHRAQRRWCLRGLPTAARRLHRGEPQQQRRHDAGDSHPQKCLAPAIVVRNPASQPQAEQDAQLWPEHVDTHRAPALLGWIVVGDHRDRWRRAASFTDGHSYACQRQGPIAPRDAAHRCHEAPSRTAIGDEVAPVGAVGVARERDRQRAVEQGEGHARQDAHGGIRHAELGLDRLDQDAHDLPIQKASSVC